MKSLAIISGSSSTGDVRVRSGTYETIGSALMGWVVLFSKYLEY